MAGQERKHRFTLFHALSILLLMMLVVPASPVLADPGGGGPAYRDQLAQGSALSARPSGAPEQSGPSSVPPGTNMVADGGFEASYPNPYWGEYDSYSYRVICKVADCGTSSARGPRSGSGWAWMGALDSADTSGVFQPIAFPACTTVTLRFYLKMYTDTGAGSNETMRVYIDSTPVYSTSATSRSYFSSYRQVTVDVSAFADGTTHYLAFESQITGSYYVSFNLDDVSLIASASPGCAIQGNTLIGGVTLSATGGYSAVSNASTHNYVLTVPAGWSGTVTPSKAGITVWDPSSRTYSNVNAPQNGQDFTPLRTISGNAGTSPASIDVSNYPGHNVLADGAGNYVVTVPYGWTGTLTPLRPGFGFIPSERSYQNLTADLTGQDFTSCTSNATVDVGGSLHREYCVDSGGRVTPQYPVLNGPVDVNGSVNLFASERVHNSTGFVNEVMGVPDNQLTNEYWFPWYDNLTMQTWILIGNPSTSATAHVHVFIAGTDMDQEIGGHAILPGQSWTPTFAVLNGPVHITSDINVFVSERVHTSQGFVQETLGYPNNRLVNKYWFPWYDNMTMQTWLLVGNPSTTTTAHVHAYIAGELMDPPGTPPEGVAIDPGHSWTPTFPRLNGPVRVESDIAVFTSERVHNATGFVQETMGYPDNKLALEYWFPWYDNMTMQSWILVGNPSTTDSAHVHIYIAGEDMNPDGYDIPAGDRITPMYARLNGPVHIVSDINVFASERVHTAQGFVQETMGMPNDQLTTRYWFPWYDNLTMQSWILVGRP